MSLWLTFTRNARLACLSFLQHYGSISLNWVHGNMWLIVVIVNYNETILVAIVYVH